MDLTYVEAPESYIDTAIEAGSLDFDRAQAYRCVRAIKKLKCRQGEDESEVQEDCRDIVVGAVEPDQPCMISEECVGEFSICAFDPSCTDACCPGECRFFPGPFAAGEPCESEQECERGTYCRFQPGADEVASCTPLPDEGESCEIFNYGADDLCAKGTFCNDDLLCEEHRKEGAACDSDDQCEPTSKCDDVCVARVKKGKPCESVDDCLHGDNICHEGECMEPLGLGDECGEWTRRCANYAVCEGNTCTELGLVGDPCDPLGLEGIPCYQDLQCDEGVCAKLEPPEAEELCPVP